LDRVYTTVNGKLGWHKVYGRRPKPSNCELCQREVPRLGWHHWDDDHLEFGMWLCWGCHKRANIMESGFVERYFQLKSKSCSAV